MSNDYPKPEVTDIAIVDVLRALADPVRLGVTETVVDGRDHWIRLRIAELEQRFPGLIRGVLAS